MTGPQSSRPPRAGFTAAGETTSTGQAGGAPAPEGDRSPARPGRRCMCGHVLVLHDISKTGQRSRCSVSSGPKATRCGCRKFTAATEPLNQENPS